VWRKRTNDDWESDWKSILIHCINKESFNSHPLHQQGILQFSSTASTRHPSSLINSLTLTLTSTASTRNSYALLKLNLLFFSNKFIKYIKRFYLCGRLVRKLMATTTAKKSNGRKLMATTGLLQRINIRVIRIVNFLQIF